METTNCDRCHWPLDPASARGGHTRHPGCDQAVPPTDDPMLLAPADQLATTRTETR